MNKTRMGTQEGKMARAIIQGVVELGSLATFATMVAVIALAIMPVG